MKKTLKKFTAIVMVVCLIFSFSITSNATGVFMIVDEIIETVSINNDFVCYDLETKTETLIPYSSIPKYSETATMSYQVSEIAARKPTVEVATLNESLVLSATTTQAFVLTPPVVSGTPQAPYSGVVAICTQYRTNLGEIGEAVATGFLVSESIVVTAAHVVRIEPDYIIDSIKVFPLYHNSKRPSISNTGVAATEIYVPDEYNDIGLDDYPDYDFAILRLSSSINNTYQFNFSYQTAAAMSIPMSISGYPLCTDPICSHDPNEYPNCAKTGYMYTCTGTIDSYTTGRIFHWIDGTKGQSGAPLYSTTGYTCYGVYVGGFPDDSNPAAARITEAYFNHIVNAVIDAWS